MRRVSLVLQARERKRLRDGHDLTGLLGAASRHDSMG